MRKQNSTSRSLTRRLVLTLLAGLCTTVALPTQAQQVFERGFQERHGRVVREVERTAELWTEVSGRVERTSAAALRSMVQSAAVVQEQAKRSLEDSEREAGMGRDNQAEKYLRSALSLTLRARDMTTRAARQLREEIGQEENARRTLERTVQRFERMSAAGDRGDSPLWDQASRLLEQARLQWRDGNFEQSLRLAQNAENLLETLAADGPERVDPDRVRLELRRTIARVEQLRERGAEEARIAPVVELLDQAREALGSGQPARAAERLRAARRLLAGVDTRDAGDGEARRIEQALSRLDSQIEQFAERVKDGAPQQAERLLAQAQLERDRAYRALEDGNLDRARQHVRAAADLLARIQRGARGRN